jgi:hypothetical protein
MAPKMLPPISLRSFWISGMWMMSGVRSTSDVGSTGLVRRGADRMALRGNGGCVVYELLHAINQIWTSHLL